MVPALLLSLSLLGVSQDDACTVTGSASAPPDRERAEAACHIARARFAELLGDPVPGVNVVLWEQPGYRTGIQGGRAVILWPNGSALGERDPAPPEFDADPWTEVLPHEIAHVLLAARYFGQSVVGAEGEYGTPFPDWFDEAVAIWAEPAPSRRDRLRELARLPAARLDLREILESEHPSTTDPRVMAMRDGTPPPDNRDLWVFYPVSFGALAFLWDMGGAPAVRELALRLHRDLSAGAGAWPGLPGLPDDWAGVERSWRTWLADGAARSRAGH